MCNYKTWYYKENLGYVIECEQCKKLQVGFGNVLLNFSMEEFDKFRGHIQHAQNKNYPVIEAGIKHIFIPAFCTGCTVLLNTKELEEIHQMLEYADNEMKAQELIGLFYKEEKE